MIKRRKTRIIRVGKISIGGDFPIAIQGMSKTQTEDISCTINEMKELKEAGCELIRLAVKTEEAVACIRKIKEKIDTPLVADIHFDYRLALSSIENGIDKIRINPGNINSKRRLIEIIDKAKEARIPIRIGINSGSVPFKYINSKDGVRRLVDFTLKYIRLFEDNNFYDIVISIKTPDIISTIEANRLIAKKINYPLHIGVTATGVQEEAVVKSAIGIGTLLNEGIGDTIRVSLTSSSVKEVIIAKAILEALNIRRFSPEVISCPTCGRCQVNLISIAKDIKGILEERSKKDRRLLSLKIAIMGCEVNGPGEARLVDIGVACGKRYTSLFKRGKVIRRIKTQKIKEELLKEIDNVLV